MTGFELARAAGYLIIEIFITPFSVATTVAIYIDLRAAKEPETLSVTFVRVRRSTPPAPTSDTWF